MTPEEAVHPVEAPSAAVSPTQLDDHVPVPQLLNPSAVDVLVVVVVVNLFALNSPTP